jgi:hypothetical protein
MDRHRSKVSRNADLQSFSVSRSVNDCGGTADLYVGSTPCPLDAYLLIMRWASCDDTHVASRLTNDACRRTWLLLTYICLYGFV